MKKLFTFLTTLLVASAAFAQQVPNHSFENWQTKSGFGLTGPFSYDLPQNWKLGYITSQTSSFVKPNIGKGMPAQIGSHSLKLSSASFSFMGATDTLGADVEAGFGINMGRPSSLEGYFQTSAVVTDPNDYGHVIVFLTTTTPTGRDTIAYGGADLDSSPNTFKPFSAPVQYLDNRMPDSAFVWILYYPKEVNSHILIDNLSLVNNITGQKKEASLYEKLALFPNPATDKAILTFNSPKAEAASLVIRDLVGKEVKTINLNTLQAGVNNVEIPVVELKKGIYLATLQSSRGTQTLRFVKQ